MDIPDKVAMNINTIAGYLWDNNRKIVEDIEGDNKRLRIQVMELPDATMREASISQSAELLQSYYVSEPNSHWMLKFRVDFYELFASRSSN